MSGVFGGFLKAVCKGGRLGRQGARDAMDHLVSGSAVEVETAAFLGALGGRGVDADELLGFAESLRSHAVTVLPDREPLVDTCGTGGDGLGTFNLSTAAAFVAAGAGAAVAKHGNRAVSSKSGSADVLEALGIGVDAEPDTVRASIEGSGFGFFFAPRFHPAMKHVGPVRRALGVRTVFNLLGPLANPALVKRQVVGIYDEGLLETYAKVLLGLGAERAMVVRGLDGMDELSLCGPTRVVHADALLGVWSETLDPESAGLAACAPEALAGGDAEENAVLLLQVLEGKAGPLLDATLYNAGAALLVAGLVPDLREGVECARVSVSSGKARGVLEGARKLQGKPA